MHILILDPGITTGYAVLTDNYDVVASGNILEPELDHWLNFIYNAHLPQYIVIEEVGTPTLSSLNQALGRIKNICKQKFPTAFWTKAADWKQTPAYRATVPRTWHGKPLTQHQRDSIRIGVWFLRFKLPRMVPK